MPPFDAIDDEEGEAIPAGLRVIDAHVHLFPSRLGRRVREWFGEHAWRVRYPLEADEVIEFQRSRGVERIVGLTYAHKAGMASSLNVFMHQLAREHELVWALGTVFPGEWAAKDIVAEALGPLGLRGLKLHCHVQCVAPDDGRLDEIYGEAAYADRPVVLHAGREPACPGYKCDVRAICSPEAVDRVLQRHPRLTLVVPHLGAADFEDYERLLGEHERLYLDTSMAIGGFFPEARPDMEMLARHADRVLFGTDFPNLPFAWDRELKRLLATELSDDQREAILWRNATRLFSPEN